MAQNTEIEWTDHTFNPWEGCQKVAPECDHCYAENRDQRFTGGIHWGPKAPRRRTSAQNWNKPRRWNAQAEAFHATHGRRQRVFCASLADVFDNAVDTSWRDDLWALIRECDQLDWLLLTKRPQNIAKMLPPDWGDGWLHVWLGTSAGTQKLTNQNIPHLFRVPAAIRFVSAEPLLGPLDLDSALSGESALNIECWGECGWCETYIALHNCWKGRQTQATLLRGRVGLDWVICGGESGPKARPMHPDWARSLRDQCVAAGVQFFFKQWGEWCPSPDGERTYEEFRASGARDMHVWPDMVAVDLVGKSRAGRLLDGREWNEWPEALR